MNNNEKPDASAGFQQVTEVKRIPSENMPVLYSNSVEIGVTIFDLTLLFGVTERLSESSMSVRDIAKVVMSPQHAKVFATLLNQRIDAYEKAFGQLPDAAKIGKPSGADESTSSAH